MLVIHLCVVCSTNTFVLLVGIVAYIFKKATPIFSPCEGGFILALRHLKIHFPIVGFSPGLVGNPVLSTPVFSLLTGSIIGIFRRTHGSFSS